MGSHFGDCLHTCPSIVLIAVRSANPVVPDNRDNVILSAGETPLPSKWVSVRVDVNGFRMRELDWTAPHPSGNFEVVSSFGNLDRTCVGDNWVDPNGNCRLKGCMPHLAGFRHVLGETVIRQCAERHGLFVDDLEAIVPDVRHAGLRVLADDNSERNIRTTIFRTALWYWQSGEIDPGTDIFMYGRVVHHHWRKRFDNPVRIRSTTVSSVDSNAISVFAREL